MTRRKILRRLFLSVLVFFIVTIGSSTSWGDKPPWSGGPGGNPKDPVTAPEPTALSLIAVGALGVAGHYLAKKRRKK